MSSELEGFEKTVTQDVFRKKQTKKNKKGGSFQAMGLSFVVLKGIQKRGYKTPTPIQRKTIPVALGGRDVVAMARTGSGKTACFLIPLFEKLMNSVKKPGARALILSPTRELALQTQKFIKDIGKFTDLKSTTILGGDAMDGQFAAIHENPDIIVATPGRLMHLCVEMDLKLQYLLYVVFDEADRLFEMGFGEQLLELVKRLPESRQTLLFSATMPKMLAEFAKAGLNDPALVRLDVESKIPEKLELVYLSCRTDEKVAALLFLLKSIIPSKSRSVVFAATKHHVEYLKVILDQAGISNSTVYSTLDPSARKINIAKFQSGKTSVLLVTDVAARGIDIPLLDFVINFNFPARPKLFVHRVGRCGRAGRAGIAYSIVSSEEFPYLLDLYLFLGRDLQIKDDDCALGSIPPHVLEEEHSNLLKWHQNVSELPELLGVCNNGYKAYLHSRPGASVESVRRAKKLRLCHLKPHPVFDSDTFGGSDENKDVLLDKIKKYRPNGTIFELGDASTSHAYAVMQAARIKHQKSIANFKRKLVEKEETDHLNTEFNSYLPKKGSNDVRNKNLETVLSNQQDSRKRKKFAVDPEYFVPYVPADHYSEKGLMVNTFNSETSTVQFDLTGDSAEQIRQQKNLKKWDNKKKKFVQSNKDSKMGKIKTESGAWISASYKTDKYIQWKEKNKIDENRASSDESEEELESQKKKDFMNKRFPNTHWGRHNEKLKLKMKSELKRPEQILKVRRMKEKQKARERAGQMRKLQRRRKKGSF